MVHASIVDRYWGGQALDFVNDVEGACSIEAVERRFKTAIAECGFHAYIIAGLPVAHTNLRPLVLADGWPREWCEIYIREKLVAVDPIPRHCFQTIEPFEWKEAPYNAETEPQAHAVMQRALDFRMAEGFCIPIHYGDGSGAAVSIAGERPDFGAGVKPAIHLMALYAHNRIRGLLDPELERPTHVLTQREREVLKWTALGKTGAEIGELLHITERTVTAHITAAARKLHACNRTATVVAALRRREIGL